METLNKKKFFEIVDRYITNNKISHAYLIEVGNYDEDYKCVLEFVKMILCNTTSEKLSDDSSNICNLVDSGNYPDLKVIEADGEWIKIAQMQELRDEFQNKSLLNNKKIYIIKEADKLNVFSANTILKFLEEPEDDIIAILLTKNRYKIIDTILSRCQILTIKDDIFIEEIDDTVIMLLESMFMKENLFIRYNEIITDIIPDKNVAKDILIKIQQILMQYLDYSTNSIDNCPQEIVDLLKNKGIKEITRYCKIIEEEIGKLQFNVNYKLWLDGLFARLIIGG